MTRDEREEKNRIIAEGLMRWYRPTTAETSECLAKNWYELRHWTLHRTSGAPIKNFSSYYWTPPDFYGNEQMSALLLDKLLALTVSAEETPSQFKWAWNYVAAIAEAALALISKETA